VASRSRWQEEQAEAEEAGTPCARESQCTDADYQGNAILCPRSFCEKDEAWIRRILTEMPETYTRMRMLLARSQQQEERVSGSREAPIPLATDIDMFMRQIVLVTCGWEETVRAVGSLSDYPEGRRRDAVQLATASRTLAAHLTILLSLGPCDVTRLITFEQALETSPEDEVRYNTAGEPILHTTMDGTAAGLEFIRLSGRARGMQGLNRGRRRITEVPCDDCQATTLVQWEARDGGYEPVIRCTNCPNAYIGTRFELLMGRIYRIQMDRTERHGHVA
jgi:hypothetical protein